MARLAAELRDRVKLVIVGTGDAKYVAYLGCLVEQQDLSRVVEFVGWQDDLAQLYAEADALLMMSGNEAYGRVTAEALWSGLPVIALASGASPEILAGGGGLLVPVGSASALAQTISRFVLDVALRERLQHEAWQAGKRLADGPSQFSALESGFYR
jgi:glycosyltransferase involved in cell wall biosynthesis